MCTFLGPLDLAYRNADGVIVGCKSSCFANLSGNPGALPCLVSTVTDSKRLSVHPANSADCCSGSFGTPGTCPASGVRYYRYFSESRTCSLWPAVALGLLTCAEDQCPNAYAYAYDEGSGTALWTCDSNLSSDYTLVFCP